MAKKTVCPISRADFSAKAKPVTIKINDEEIAVPVKLFSTGSLGWYLNRKIDIDVGGVKVPVQIGLNLTIVGSKELPQDAPPAPAAHAAGHTTHAAPAHEAHTTHTDHAHAAHDAEKAGESHQGAAHGEGS
jgi:hypothetical protein